MILKQYIYGIINEKDLGKNHWNKTFEFFITGLIGFSVIQIILESFQDINNKYGQFFQIFEIISVMIFSIEYFFRIWTAELKYPNISKWRARLKFISSFVGVVDLIAILPFYLPFIFKFDLRFIRILRVLRLLRILKIHRYTQALKLVGTVFHEKRSELGASIFITFILMLVSSTIMYNLENEVQPEKFPDIISTFWWSVATLTTVGYGDVYPITGWGKLVSGIIALLGIGLVAIPTGIISAGFIQKMEENKKHSPKEIKGFTYCHHCGTKL